MEQTEVTDARASLLMENVPQLHCSYSPNVATPNHDDTPIVLVLRKHKGESKTILRPPPPPPPPLRKRVCEVCVFQNGHVIQLTHALFSLGWAIGIRSNQTDCRVDSTIRARITVSFCHGHFSSYHGHLTKLRLWERRRCEQNNCV